LLEKANGDVKALPVICSPLEVNETVRYVINDIIGEVNIQFPFFFFPLCGCANE